MNVVEIVAPAVKTELHDYMGKGGEQIGMDLDAFIKLVWKGLEEGRDDIAVGLAEKTYEGFEEKRQAMFQKLVELMKGSEKV